MYLPFVSAALSVILSAAKNLVANAMPALAMRSFAYSFP
jgi:hypothetical protein